MRPTIRKTVAGAGAAALVLTLAACGGGGGDSGGGESGGKAQKGGTLILRNFATFEHLDPQRTYVGAALSFINRTFSQTLTTFPAKEGALGADELIGDAATDTGKASDDLKTWSFTLRDGLKWQDGKEVTCEDFKYGASRTFATDQITGGPNYQIQWLDIPTAKDGTSVYKGPYKGTGQAAYDKAVTCDGKTITYKLNSPHADFNMAVNMGAFSAFRKDKDEGAKSDFKPFSNGPYKLQGTWNKDKGGILVRNDQWDPKADGGLRKAYPDKIDVRLGDKTETISQAMISDSGDAKDTVSYSRVAPSMVSTAQSSANAKKRLVTDVAPYTDYVFFNLTKMKNAKVREAVATAFDKQAYATTSGGKTAMEPADGGVINPTLPDAYAKFDPFDAGAKGDPAKAKQLLQEAGVETPYPLTYTYRGSATQDKVSAGIQEALKKAGFEIKLKKVPESSDYYAKIQDPKFLADVDFGWTSWGADWPSASTVVPALYTGQQVEKVSRGQNYSGFKDADYDKRVKENYSTADPKAAEKKWNELDQEVIEKTVVYPVGYNTFTYLYGSNVKGFVFNQAMGACVDLAVVSVK